MKTIKKTKYVLIFLLLTLTAGSALANTSHKISDSGKALKNNPPRLIATPKNDRLKQKKIFKDKHNKKVGYDTHSLSEFFKRLRKEKEAKVQPIS